MSGVKPMQIVQPTQPKQRKPKDVLFQELEEFSGVL
jgi:hypothetical protein